MKLVQLLQIQFHNELIQTISIRHWLPFLSIKACLVQLKLQSQKMFHLSVDARPRNLNSVQIHFFGPIFFGHALFFIFFWQCTFFGPIIWQCTYFLWIFEIWFFVVVLSVKFQKKYPKVSKIATIHFDRYGQRCRCWHQLLQYALCIVLQKAWNNYNLQCIKVGSRTIAMH